MTQRNPIFKKAILFGSKPNCPNNLKEVRLKKLIE